MAKSKIKIDKRIANKIKTEPKTSDNITTKVKAKNKADVKCKIKADSEAKIVHIIGTRTKVSPKSMLTRTNILIPELKQLTLQEETKRMLNISFDLKSSYSLKFNTKPTYVGSPAGKRVSR